MTQKQRTVVEEIAASKAQVAELLSSDVLAHTKDPAIAAQVAAFAADGIVDALMASTRALHALSLPDAVEQGIQSAISEATDPLVRRLIALASLLAVEGLLPPTI